MPSEYEVNQEEVNSIVEAMKRKYRSEGLEFDEISSSLRELREIIAEDSYSKIDIDNEEDLVTFDSGLAKFFGGLYLKMKKLLNPIQKRLKRLSLNKELSYHLYSANMHYSSSQYIAIASSVSFLLMIIGFVISTIFASLILKNIFAGVAIALAISIVLGAVALVMCLRIPLIKAKARGNACAVELPFALRHMSTELKAGLSLYKTLQAVTASDYGILSEEFAKTINEVEEGTSMQVALKHLALRTQSKALRTTIMHIIRAMRIGGNLSGIMSDIAEDVSKDLKSRINAFSQQMNLIAVVFIFLGIVIPVGVTILGAIRNSPIAQSGQDFFKNIPLSPQILVIFYVLAMPAFFILLTLMIYFTQPKM